MSDWEMVSESDEDRPPLGMFSRDEIEAELLSTKRKHRHLRPLAVDDTMTGWDSDHGGAKRWASTRPKNETP